MSFWSNAAEAAGKVAEGAGHVANAAGQAHELYPSSLNLQIVDVV